MSLHVGTITIPLIGMFMYVPTSYMSCMCMHGSVCIYMIASIWQLHKQLINRSHCEDEQTQLYSHALQLSESPSVLNYITVHVCHSNFMHYI